MRIYFLLLTPLADVGYLSIPPGKGDAICYIRHAQDPKREAAKKLKQQDIAVYFLDDFLGEDITNSIDDFGARFLKEWFVDSETDFSDIGDLSLGTAYSTELARQITPRVLVRFGEALRRLIKMHPEASEILSDARDGAGVFKVKAAFFPIGKTVQHVAISMGCKINIIPPVNDIPPAFGFGQRNSISVIVRSFFGQYRPAWLRAKRAYRRNRKDARSRPTLYSFIGRAQDIVVQELAKRQKFNVVCNWLGVPGTHAMRSDHLFAVPTFGDIGKMRKLLHEIRSRAVLPDIDARYVFAGIKYDEILYNAVYEVLISQIWSFSIVIAQSRKFQKFSGVSALLINDATNEPMGNLVSFNRYTGMKIYLLPHGMNVTKRSFFAPSVDHTHVNYLAYGKDHSGFYRAYLDKSEEIQRSLVGSPLTVIMNDIYNKRPPEHGKRLLILTFGHTQFWNSARVYAADQYYIDIFGILPALVKEGWSVSLRTHAGGFHELEDLLGEEFGIGEELKWNDDPTIGDALLSHDVVVSNVTTAFYQSLFAGCPTIFYEPDYRNVGGIEGIETDPMFTGLPTAWDLERPVTNNPKTLASMIRDSLNPETMVSTFPARFANELAPRFIGPDPAHSDQIIADFIEENFFGEKVVPARPNEAETV